MLKRNDLKNVWEYNLKQKPLTEYFQNILANTQSDMQRRALIYMFELNQWELPAPFQRKKDREMPGEL